MSQQINLFNPRFRKEKRYLTAAALALMVGAALFASLAVGVAVRGRVALLETQDADVKARLQAAQARRTEVLAALVPRPKDASIEAELTRLEAEHRALRGVSDILERNRVGDPRGYSAYFEALARSRVAGVWLTGVEVDGSSADLGLRGRALNAELVPGYLAGLAREPALQGKAFGHVEIAQPSAGPTVAKGADDSAAPAAQAAPPWVEFTLRAAGGTVPEGAR